MSGSTRQATSSPLSHTTMQTRKTTTWEQFILPERQKSFPSFAASSPQLSAALGFSPNMNSGSPFVSSPHGHPGFTPSKLGGRSSVSNDGRNQKQPKPPEKPLMPYMRYSRKVWEQVRAENADMKVYDIGKLIGQMWRDMPADQKQEYADQYELEKMEYNQLLRAFHDSPAYQSWINCKSAKPAESEKQCKKSTGFQSPQKLTDGKVTLQTVDDDEDVDEFSQKHVAAARYLRNHRLVNEIFSDSVVPDVRSVVMTNRMQVLKRQVQSLTNHQKKLEAELSQIEEKFEAKKRRFLDASETFQKEMKERCEAKLVDAVKYQKMIDKAVEEITADMEKARQVREEQTRIQKLDEAKREAEAAAVAASLPASGAPDHPEAAVRPNSSEPHAPAPGLFLESHQLAAESDAMTGNANVSQFGDLSNPPDIAGTDSLTNDSLATTCSQSQESLPPDAAATHDPAMDEDTDAEDTLDESLEEQADEMTPDEARPELPLPPAEEATEPMETSVSDVIPAEEPVLVPEAAPPAPQFHVQTPVPEPEVAIHPIPVPQIEQESLPQAEISVQPDLVPPHEEAVPVLVPVSDPAPGQSDLPPVSTPPVTPAAVESDVEPVLQVALEDIPLPPEPVEIAAESGPVLNDDPVPTVLAPAEQVVVETVAVEPFAVPVEDVAVDRREDAGVQLPLPCIEPAATAVVASFPEESAAAEVVETATAEVSQETPVSTSE